MTKCIKQCVGSIICSFTTYTAADWLMHMLQECKGRKHLYVQQTICEMYFNYNNIHGCMAKRKPIGVGDVDHLIIVTNVKDV